MAGAPAVLQAALDGRPVSRPLRAPLLSALAAEVEELDLREFLGDAGKRSRILAGLAASLPLDVLVVDSGSGWDAEATGLTADWSTGYPPTVHAVAGAEPRFDPRRGAATVIVDLLGRLRAVIAEPVALGVTVRGPAALAAVSGGSLELQAATQVVLEAARMVAEAGASVVFVRERGEDEVNAERYMAATAPLWRSLRFFRSVGLLHVSSGADGWRDVLASAGPFLPVFDAARSPRADAAVVAAERPYGLALSPDAADPSSTNSAARLPVGERCVLITHDGDLVGHLPVRDLATAVAQMSA